MSQSRWIKCISTVGNIRGVAIQATDLVRDTARLHGTQGEGARGLGESLIGALLLSSYCKMGERVNLNIQGSGFIRQALVDAYPDGAVRGYVIERPPEQQPERNPAHEGPWGAGLLSVLKTKTSEEHKQPYIGTVPLLTGHLAKDLTFYWAQSEQVPSAVGLIVNLDDQGEVTAAGGFLIQALPGASPAEVLMIEEHINHIALAEQFANESNPLHLLSTIFQSTAFIIVEEKPLVFRCSCSWERVERALMLVGPAELQAMLAQDHNAIVRCDFCTKEYQIDAAGLQRLIDVTTGKKS